MNRHTMAKNRPGEKEYLGDGVYVVHDGYGMWLTAENGLEATDAIYVEPKVLENLKLFVTKVRSGNKLATEK